MLSRSRERKAGLGAIRSGNLTLKRSPRMPVEPESWVLRLFSIEPQLVDDGSAVAIPGDSAIFFLGVPVEPAPITDAGNENPSWDGVREMSEFSHKHVAILELQIRNIGDRMMTTRNSVSRGEKSWPR